MPWTGPLDADMIKNFISLCLMQIFRSDYTQIRLTRKLKKNISQRKFLNVDILKELCIYHPKVQWNQDIQISSIQITMATESK